MQSKTCLLARIIYRDTHLQAAEWEYGMFIAEFDWVMVLRE